MVDAGETPRKLAENATTGVPIGIDATMGILILKSKRWSNATLNSSMVRQGE
jgi:hypothetical protein